MEPESRVILFRHGTADAAGICYGRRLDPPLAPAGTAQVREAAQRLARRLAVDRVVCSPARRATAAAALLGHAAPTVDERWAERDFGEWEGRRWEKLWADAPAHLQRDPVAYAAFVPPGAETPQAVTTRVLAALDAVAAAPGTALVITHAGPIRVALAHALGVELATAFRIAVPPGRAVGLGRIGRHWIVEGVGW